MDLNIYSKRLHNIANPGGVISLAIGPRQSEAPPNGKTFGSAGDIMTDSETGIVWMCAGGFLFDNVSQRFGSREWFMVAILPFRPNGAIQDGPFGPFFGIRVATGGGTLPFGSWNPYWAVQGPSLFRGTDLSWWIKSYPSVAPDAWYNIPWDS